MSSDYAWRIATQNAHGEPLVAAGYLVDSINDSAVGLLWEVLREWKSGRPLPIDNHGFATQPEGIEIPAEELFCRLDKEKGGKTRACRP